MRRGVIACISLLPPAAATVSLPPASANCRRTSLTVVGLRRLSIGAGCKAPRSCRIGMRIILRWNVRFPRSRAWRAHRCSARTPSGRPVRRASTRRMPRRSSGWAIGFEITGWPRRSCRAAPENEPVSMTRTKASIADRSRGPGARDSGPHLSGQGCSDHQCPGSSHPDLDDRDRLTQPRRRAEPRNLLHGRAQDPAPDPPH